MKQFISAIVFIALLHHTAGYAQHGFNQGSTANLSASNKEPHKIAVLNFENHTDRFYDRFVRSLTDMLMTSLGQGTTLTVIERVQINKAMENFRLELSGPIDTHKAVEVGQWLGADAVVLGSFTRFGADYRIDARLIDAATGELVVAQNVRGPENEVIGMVDRLGAELIERFGAKRSAVAGATGFLRVRFMMSRAEMTECLAYHQICKLFIDGQEQGLSPVIDQTDTWISLFTQELETGKHIVQLVHGFVADNTWDGEFTQQPKVFTVAIEPGSTTSVQYSFSVGWFSDGYYYSQPWRP
jgi:TolB-like protein